VGRQVVRVVVAEVAEQVAAAVVQVAGQQSCLTAATTL